MESRLSRIATLWSVVRNAHDPESAVAQQAQQKLWEQYSGAARRYLGSALRDDDAVDEIMQELALKLVRQEFRNADADKGSFRSFMKTVLFRMVAGYRRSQGRKKVFATDDADDLADQPVDTGQQEFIHSWREEVLTLAWIELEELEEESGRPWNSVLRARIDHPKLTSSQLAEIVTERTGSRISESNYRVLLHRSREKFADLLVGRVADTLQNAAPQQLQEELAELRLLEFCQPAVARLTQTDSNVD